MLLLFFSKKILNFKIQTFLAAVFLSPGLTSMEEFDFLFFLFELFAKISCPDWMREGTSSGNLL